MKFVLEYPSELPDSTDEFLDPAVMAEVSRSAEAAGYFAVGLSEHPAPSVKWRENGGHHTIDPIAALSFIAGATSSLRVMTNLYVLVFRTPYLAAKALSGLNLVSGGRFIAGVGAGYLRSEFAALGVEFEQRAALFDESLDALVRIWADPATPVSGTGFAAVGPVVGAAPVGIAPPPLWIGGNSRATLRRVAAYGSGWLPLITPPAMASAIRTPVIETADAFSRRLAELHAMLDAAGRQTTDVEVQVVCPPVDLDSGSSVAQAHDFLADLAARGATSCLVHTVGTGPRAAIDYLEGFSSEFFRTRKAARR